MTARHVVLADLTDRHMGREITLTADDGFPNVTGVLTGIVGGPGKSVSLTLGVGPSRLHTPFRPGSTPVLVGGAS